MSFWGWLKRALGVASEPRVLEDVGKVASDVGRVIEVGPGILAVVDTVKDVGELVGEIQGDGTVPMPLGAADVARQRAQMASATAHPDAKAPALVGSAGKGGSTSAEPNTPDAGRYAAVRPAPIQGDRTRK